MKQLVQNLALIVFLSIGTHANVAKIVCYFGSWAIYRESNAKFNISSIDPNLCTHIIYSFAGLKDGVIVSLDPWADLPDNYGKNGYGQLQNLKQLNSNLKIAIAMGGWNEGSAKYSQAVSTNESRSKLANSILNYVIKYNFDGFDLDWEFPGQNGGAAEDKVNLVLFLQELRQVFSPYKKELSVAVSANVNTSQQSYNVREIAKNVDFINLMTYDFHTDYKVLGHNAPFGQSMKLGDNLNSLSTIKYWFEQGAPLEKLILGIPFYGRTFVSNNIAVGSESSGPGPSGPYTKQPGFLSYLELCEKFNHPGWQMFFDNKQSVPYAYNQDTKEWISYENEMSIEFKTWYAKQMSLGGVMIWSIDYDDINGVCGKGKFTLLNAVTKGLLSSW